MRRLHARHRTELRYAGAVGESVNEIRLVPGDDGRQQVEWSHVRVQPGTELLPHRDCFGNEVRWFQIVQPHDTLVIEAEAIVTTRAGVRGGSVPQQPMAATADPAYVDRWAEFLAGSAHVRWTEPVDAFARLLELDESRGLVEWGRSLEYAVNRAIVYRQGVTRVDTPLEEVVRVGHGVCQDMAHLMIAVARRRGVAARYVSGWLNPGHDEPGESHAWVELSVPDLGWVEFDPTHPDPDQEHYVRLAVGRDYADVPPLRGSYLGPATTSMSVTVEVRELP